MHHSLKDTYRRRATIAEIVLLGASVIFLITTFADTSFYDSLGLPCELSKVILGLTSAATFFCSLVLLLLDWPGKAASHKDSADRWFQVLIRFRESREKNDTWPEENRAELSKLYVDCCNTSTDIPDKKFNALKVQYLSKIEVSKLASKHPGLPYIVLWLVVKYKAFKTLKKT